VGTVIVTDGRLTISNGAGAISNRLDFVEISAVEPTTLPQWRALYFGTTSNSGSAADTADPDQDNLVNLLEYASGRSPLIADAAVTTKASITHQQGTDWLQLQFPRNSNATDLHWDVQIADVLSAPTWSTIASFAPGTGWSGSASVSESNLGSGTVQVTVRDSSALNPTGTRLYRVVVTPSP
jgi:hypothetical protein